MLTTATFRSVAASIKVNPQRLTARLAATVGTQQRLFTVSSNRQAGHHHAPAKSQETLLQALSKRFPGQENSVADRLEQLKRNHMQYLSLDINWATYKPEQQTEFLRDLEDLVKEGYHTMTAEQKKAVSLASALKIEPTKDFKLWDSLLQKNEELQKADWKNLTLDEKKAAYYIAWGPKPEADSEFRQAVALRVGAFLAVSIVVYYALFNYFRSKKSLPSLDPEWKAAEKKRLIEARSNPYNGESAHLFTKDGIKEA